MRLSAALNVMRLLQANDWNNFINLKEKNDAIEYLNDIFQIVELEMNSM